MSKNINFISHKKSTAKVDGKPKLPSGSALEDGEIAINYAKDVETISIKNESGDVVSFSSDNYYTELKLGSGFTGENSANTVTDVIKENEEIVSAALIDLDDRKADKTDIPSLNAYATKSWVLEKNYLDTETFDEIIGDGFTPGHTVTKVIEDNGKVMSAALVDLNRRKADKTDIPSLDAYATKSWVVNEKLGSGFTSGNTVTQVIEENEEAIASALVDLDDRKADKSDIPSLGAYATKSWVLGKDYVNSSELEEVKEDKISKIISVTYDELLALRNDNALVPGQQYRITDYVTTTSQINTKSAGKQFDLIVTADSVDMLNENARAAAHSNDATGFTDAKFESWEVKYCLDNDETRFEWAAREKCIVTENGDSYSDKYAKLYRCPSLDGFNTDTNYSEYQIAWACDDTCSDGDNALFVYSINEDVYVGDIVFFASDGEEQTVLASCPRPTGVIYYLKDEFGNECGYDFKNIQFLRYKITGGTIVSDGFTDAGRSTLVEIDDSNPYYLYTFSWITEDNEIEDLSVVGNDPSFYDDFGKKQGVFGNKIKNMVYDYKEYDDKPTDNTLFRLPCNVFVATYSYDEPFSYGCHSNILSENCFNNTFNEEMNGNKLGRYCQGNLFYSSKNNIIGNNFISNILCWSSFCMIGNECSGITIGNNSNGNSFGNNCADITIGNISSGNSFGNGCVGINFTQPYTKNCSFEAGVMYVSLGSATVPTASSPIRDIRVLSGVKGTSQSAPKTITATLNTPAIYRASGTTVNDI